MKCDGHKKLKTFQVNFEGCSDSLTQGNFDENNPGKGLGGRNCIARAYPDENKCDHFEGVV